ncbi:MAG: anti-sigma factor [Solirubrobacterales bacterium]
MMEPNRDLEIADYLSGELSAEDRRRFERELAADETLREEVESLRRITVQLQESADLDHTVVETPALTLPVEEIPPGNPTGGSSRTWLRPKLALAALAGAAAVAAVVIVLVASNATQSVDPGSTVALSPIDEGPAAARGELQSRQGERSATLTVSGLAPSGQSDYYEVWLISQGQRELLPLGSFSVGADGKADVTVELPLDSERFRFVDISLEPDDGDPSHSGDSVLRGPASLS